MGTIIKFVINMEGLDADLDQIQNTITISHPTIHIKGSDIMANMADPNQASFGVP